MFKVRVAGKTIEARDVCAFDLVHPDGLDLPAFTAGAHIDVHLPGGLIRQYSLCNSPIERHRYRIAVLKAPTSRGGSEAMHAQVQIGDILQIGEPRNLFALSREASPPLLFAGGIGITPILAMAQHLTSSGEAFSLHYCARSPDRAAFLQTLAASEWSGTVATYFDDGAAEQKLDAAAILVKAAPQAHLYVCGPTGFMDHILQTARSLGWAETRLHREYFTAAPVDHAADDAFSVKIASSGLILEIPANKTALETLIDNGFDIPMSCEQGICGTCLTGVLDGLPDHRDQFQTEEEQARNDQFTPCCSRARTPILVLDL